MMGDFSGEGDGSLGTTSLGLLERMKAHEQEAWERFATLYGHVVLSMCRRAGLQPADRADVFQEVSFAVARHLATFRHDRPGDTFRGWLRSITRTKIVDLLRRQGRYPIGWGGSAAQQLMRGVCAGQPDPNGHSVNILQRGENAVLAGQAIRLVRGEFEERTWQAFWQTAAQGLSASVAAERLGMSAGAVRVAKCRVLRRIRDELRGLIE